MTLTELRYIVAVAQERHFGRAAQRCFVSQPTLSIAIKKLEEELSVSLFDRSSNEVITTEAGERIITQARRAGRSRAYQTFWLPKNKMSWKARSNLV